jgi:Domain of unknown function (DUF4365)
VSAILNRIGALAEPIRNDYGEDLFVQSHLKGEADNFRLLIQVKGTSLGVRADGSRSFSLRVDHLLRWISQSDPMLVCVFDNATGGIHAFSPNARLSLWQLSTTEKKSISVKLSKEDEFNDESAKRFIWTCRIELFSRMFSWYENHVNYHASMGGPKSKRKEIQLNGNVVLLTFLKAVGIVEGDSMSKEFRDVIRNCSINLGRDNKEKSTNFDLESVFTLGLLGQVDRVCHSGLPPNLMVHGARLCITAFKHFHSEELLTAERNLGKLPP